MFREAGREKSTSRIDGIFRLHEPMRARCAASKTSTPRVRRRGGGIPGSREASNHGLARSSAVTATQREDKQQGDIKQKTAEGLPATRNVRLDGDGWQQYDSSARYSS